MDQHCKIAAALHVAVAGISLVLLCLVAATFGLMYAKLQVPAFTSGIATVLFGMFMLIALTELIAGICFLRGFGAARAWLIGFSVVGLFYFPFGTAVGVYSLWAFLREAVPSKAKSPEFESAA